jgi:hypothetical protein
MEPSMPAIDPGREPMREIQQNMAPSPPRTWAPVPTGVAFLSAVLLVLAYWNVAGLVVLHDHPLPALIFWPAVWVLLAVAVTMLIPSDLRTGPAIAWACGGTGLFVLFAGCAGLVASIAGVGPSGRHGDRVAVVSSADGRYQVEVFEWQAVLGEPGWDVVIYRRDGLRGTEAYAGCLFSEASAWYDTIQSVQAGSVRIATDAGPVFVAFDPTTMQVTQPIPVDLCGGYE